MRLAVFLAMILSLVVMGCEKTNEPAPTPVLHFYDTINIDGRTRQYLLNLPPNFDSTNNFPLVVALHGFAGTASQMEQDYLLTEQANAAKFVIVYPEGTKSQGPLGFQSWNAGSCCEIAQVQNVNDVGFVSQLIQKLVRRYKVNPKKVYVTGMSNGAMMTYRLACEIPQQIAAIAPVSGSLMATQPCEPSRRVPVLHIHSVLDNKVPYGGGVALANYYYPPVDSALRVWAGNNGCGTHAQLVADSALYTEWEYTGCAAGSTVRLKLTKDGGHAWPGGMPARPGADEPSKAFDASDVIWKFFEQYSLP